MVSNLYFNKTKIEKVSELSYFGVTLASSGLNPNALKAAISKGNIGQGTVLSILTEAIRNI